jgi:hypothetical protein
MSDFEKLIDPRSHAPVTSEETWPEQPLPLVASLDDPLPYPMDQLPDVLCGLGGVIQRTVQAPDAIIGNSLLAAASLAVQAHANVALPHGGVSPLSLFLISVAESGERKSAVDNLVLRPHQEFERRKKLEYDGEMAEFRKLPKEKQAEATPPRQPIFTTSDPTIEGIAKLLAVGLPTLGLFSAEGGRFIGGYSMSEDSALRTAAGLSTLWDGTALDRVRAGDGATKMYNRRLALHLMSQPRATFAWLANPMLRDQGLFARVLVGFPASMAGTRLYRDEKPHETPEFAAYMDAMSRLLDVDFTLNDGGELDFQTLYFGEKAKNAWIKVHNQIEQSIPDALRNVRHFASKAAEQIARIAGVIQMVRDPDSTQVSLDSFKRAASIFEWYLNEAVRLSGAQPVKEGTDKAELLRSWLQSRGKRFVTLVELTQKGPSRLRAAKSMRELMNVLADHYYVRPIEGGYEYEGRMRKEAWEVRQ